MPGACIISKLKGATLIERQRVNVRGAYFKLRSVIHMKFRNSITMSMKL